MARSRRPLPPAAGAASPAAGSGHPGSYLPGETEYFALRSRDRADLPGTGELRCVLRSSAVWVGDCAGTGTHGAADPPGLPGRHPWPQPPSRHVLPGQHLLPGQHQPAGPPDVTGRPVALGQPAAMSQPDSGQRAPDWPAVRDPATGRGQWRLSRRAVMEAWGTCGVGVRAVLTSAELVAFLDTVLTGEARALAGTEPAVSQQTSRSGGSIPYWRQRGRVPDATARTRLPAVRAQARGGAHAPGDPQARWGDVRR